MERVYTYIDVVYDGTIGTVFKTLSRVIADATSDAESKKEVIELPGETLESAPATFRPLSTVLEKRTTEENLTNSIAYIGSTRVPLFFAPTKEFDTVVTTIPYGTMVMVLEEKGRFSRVMVDEKEGWVLRDDLSDRAAYVYPEFVVGEANHADDPNTQRLRAAIGDEFCGTEAEVPLQAGEYVLYKLMRRGKKINWPAVRPRIPGRWHTILKGNPGIHIGIAPKTGSVMECTLENDMGHLAYVEAAFPDERITISEAHYPDDGIYNERTLTKEEWQKLNPIFIEVQ
jgi:hypothetical protein